MKRILNIASVLLFIVVVNFTYATDFYEWEEPNIKVFPTHTGNASQALKLDSLIRDGKSLFTTKFNRIDGAGRPAATGDSKPTPRDPSYNLFFTRISGPDATSCHACHNQPGVGGSGDFVANVFVGAHFLDRPVSSIEKSTTNERNTISIQGGGLIETVAREMTWDLHQLRDRAIKNVRNTSRAISIKLESKGVNFGVLTVRNDTSLDFSQVAGIDYDLVVRPFGTKGIATSLREFTIAALNQHHGIQAIERFGWERTGTQDFDEDGVENELDIGQVTALVLFQASLQPPAITNLDIVAPAVLKGKELFRKVGCDVCHVPSLPLRSEFFLEPNPYNRPGNLRNIPSGAIRLNLKRFNLERNEVPAYTDLKRHNLCDDKVNYFCNELIKQDNVDTHLFLTAKLWDLATSAPYGHRGDLGTISEVILAHGGEAADQRMKFLNLKNTEKRMLIKFLKSLGVVSN